MDPEAAFDAGLSAAGVEFAESDARLLRAVHEHGSLNRAADALDRSYSRSQQRVVELEEAFGRLVERTRGGSGGGGSTLTGTARGLLREFDRLQAEFTGVAEAEETVLPGTVVDSTGELATVETDPGRIRAIVPATTPDVRLSVRADAVTLHAPDAVPERETSARNRFGGEVSRVETGAALARVTVDVGADTDLTALVTRASADALDLAPGVQVVASFKATATRAFPAGRYLLGETGTDGADGAGVDESPDPV
jgi:molybdate transport system regulatory protein